MSRSLAITVLAAVIAAVTAGPASALSTPPSKDPFYTPPASYADAAPGSVLATRQVTVSFAGSPATVAATQILYRTTNQLGKPSATVATLLRPAVPTPLVRLVSYQTAYNGVADTCRPSYALQDGNSAANSVVSTANHQAQRWIDSMVALKPMVQRQNRAARSVAVPRSTICSISRSPP